MAPPPFDSPHAPASAQALALDEREYKADRNLARLTSPVTTEETNDPKADAETHDDDLTRPAAS